MDIDPATWYALKSVLAADVKRRDRASAKKHRRRYRYRGTIFLSANRKDTDGWYADWERQKRRNRNR